MSKAALRVSFRHRVCATIPYHFPPPMTEYPLGLARKFAEAAQLVAAQGLIDIDERRVVAYNSRISMELSLKSFLERAGMPVSTIVGLQHRLRDMLREVDKCSVQAKIGDSNHAVAASRLRAVTVTVHGQQITAGHVLEAEEHGASRYPVELRYGAPPRDFPAETLVAAAGAIVEWVDAHADGARWPTSP